MLDFPAQLLHVYAELSEQAGGYRRVRTRTVNLESAAIEQVQAAAQLKLVALGMPAKIIVIVEDQDAAGPRPPGAEKVRGRQPADATAHHDQVIRFVGIRGSAGLSPVAQGMRILE